LVRRNPYAIEWITAIEEPLMLTVSPNARLFFRLHDEADERTRIARRLERTGRYLGPDEVVLVDLREVPGWILHDPIGAHALRVKQPLPNDLNQVRPRKTTIALPRLVERLIPDDPGTGGMRGRPLLDVRMMVVDQIVTDHPELLPAMMYVAVVKPEVTQKPLVALVNPRRVPVQGTRQNFDVRDLPELPESLERSRDGFDR
jgi:hypothetical protein